MKQSKVRRLWGFVRGDRLRFILTIVFTMFNVFFNYLPPLIIAWTIDGVLNHKQINAPAFVSQFIDRIGGFGYLSHNLWVCGLGLVLATACRGLFAFLQGTLTGVYSEGTVKRIKDALFSHLQELPYDYHVKAETGDLVQRCTTDVETVRRFLSGNLIELARCLFILTFAIIILGHENMLLTLLSLILMPVSFVYSYFFGDRIQKQFKLVDEADGAMSTVLQENLTGVRVVRAFGREGFERDKFNKSVDTLLGHLVKLGGLMATFWSFSDFTAMSQQAITLFGAMYFVIKGDMSLGTFLIFNTYIAILVWPVRQLGRVISDASKMFISIGRIGEVLDEVPETSGENAVAPPLAGDIEFDHVSFGYEGTPVLRDISFKVRKGETVALLGGTGSGKSTLVQLLQRLYDYDEGSVKINGTELKKIEKRYLRSRVGIVLQEPFLYSKTLRENIGISDEDCELSMIYDAARTAAVHDVIESFEQKYDTMVGERGVTLSGGQKQRVAIARTLVRDNDILIFDDSLSAVDTETDRAIRKELREKCRGVTTFIISHRISTLSEADRILVLEGGQITAVGSHEQLIAQDGLYRRIWQIQSSDDSEADAV